MALSDVRLGGNWEGLCMVRSNGEAWAVGYGPSNGHYSEVEWPQTGLTPPFDTDLLYPWGYLGQSNVKKMVMTSQFTGIILKADGTVWVTGANEGSGAQSSLGLGSRQDTWNTAGTAYTWVKIPGLGGIVDIEAGEYTVMALKDDGRLFGWGYGGDFQLNPAGTDANTPTLVHGLDDVVDFSIGWNHVAVVRDGGSLWTWGIDGHGGLGQGIAHDFLVDHPVQIDTGVDRVETGLYHTLYRKTTGQLWGAGSGLAIGAGDVADHAIPIQLTGPGLVTNFSAGEDWSIAINASNARVWTVGDNNDQQLGRASLAGASSETWGLLEGPTGAPVTAVDVVAAPVMGMYVRDDCAVFSWGQNDNGAAGTKDWWLFENAVPQQIIKNTDYDYDAWDGNVIDYDQANTPFDWNSVILTDTGAIYQWGANMTQADYDLVNAAEQPGDPGYDSGVANEYPTLIDTFPGAIRIGCIGSLMYVIKNDGTLWRKGTVSDPDLTQIVLGNLSTAGRGYLTDGWEQVPGLSNITDISCGGDTHALVQDGDGVCYAIGWSRWGACGFNAFYDEGTKHYMTWAPDGVLVDAAGAVAFMSGGKIQTDWHGCYCAYPPLGLHHTGLWNVGAAYHEHATDACVRVFPSDWFNGLNNVVSWWTTNAFPTTYTDYGIGFMHGVYIVSGVATVSGLNNGAEIGNGTSQNGLTLGNEAWWSDDDLTNIPGVTLEPFDEPGPICFKGTNTPISDFTEVLSVGYSGMFLRRANGEVWGWGGFPDSLGDPSLPYEPTADNATSDGFQATNGGWAIHIPFWDDFTSINMNYYGGLALRDDGQPFGWGDSIQAGQGYADGSAYVSPPQPIFPGEPVVTAGNALFACDDPLENGGGGDEGPPVDGEPPDTIPNEPLSPPGPGVVPVPPPVGGGCKASMDGPSSCNFDVPIIGPIPMPDDEIEFPEFEDPELPDFTPPDFPIDEIEIPEFSIDCFLPDFGNLSECKPKAGTGGGLPGGRDNKGRRGSGHGGIKLGGPTYKKRRQTFNQWFPHDPDTGEPVEDPDTGEPVIPPQRSWPAGSSVMTAIMVILLDLGISPLKIIFEIGPEWDKTFGPKTFPETTPMFAAAEWLAQLIMCRIIDEGSPTGNIYIGPPTHHPHSQTWTFMDYFPNPEGNPPFFNIVHGYSGTEAYFAVKVWGAHFSPPKFALVDTIFANDPQNLLEIEVGPDYSPGDAQDLANYRAALIRQAAVSVQITVPYNEGYFMRDEMVVQSTLRGEQETYTIFGKQSDIGLEGNTHILTGVLPATLEMLANFPDVLEDPEPVGLAFLEAPEAGRFAIRPETKRKAEGRVQRQLELWAIREGVKATMNGSR